MESVFSRIVCVFCIVRTHFCVLFKGKSVRGVFRESGHAEAAWAGGVKEGRREGSEAAGEAIKQSVTVVCICIFCSLHDSTMYYLGFLQRKGFVRGCRSTKDQSAFQIEMGFRYIGISTDTHKLKCMVFLGDGWGGVYSVRTYVCLAMIIW